MGRRFLNVLYYIFIWLVSPLALTIPISFLFVFPAAFFGELLDPPYNFRTVPGYIFIPFTSAYFYLVGFVPVLLLSFIFKHFIKKRILRILILIILILSAWMTFDPREHTY